MTERTRKPVTITLHDDEVIAADSLARQRFNGSRSRALGWAARLAERCMLGVPSGPAPEDPAEALAAYATGSLSTETWQALQSSAVRRLARALSEPEMIACLAVTNGWWVTGADAAMIDAEIEDAEPPLLSGVGTVLDMGIGADHGIDAAALVARLRAMPEIDRAVLTLRCRAWWDLPAEERTLERVLGKRLRGPRSN